MPTRYFRLSPLSFTTCPVAAYMLTVGMAGRQRLKNAVTWARQPGEVKLACKLSAPYKLVSRDASHHPPRKAASDAKSIMVATLRGRISTHLTLKLPFVTPFTVARKGPPSGRLPHAAPPHELVVRARRRAL
eukprot:366271-Chlamydomonas_euryale.AAC.3